MSPSEIFQKENTFVRNVCRNFLIKVSKNHIKRSWLMISMIPEC